MAAQVHAVHSIKKLGRDIEKLGHRADSRIAHEDVDTLKMLDRVRDKFSRSLVVGQIAGQQQARSTALFDLNLHSVGGGVLIGTERNVGASVVIDRYRCPLARQRDRRRLAHATRSTGDQRDLSL